MSDSSTFVDFYRQAYGAFPMEHRTGGSVPIELFSTDQDNVHVTDRYDGMLVVSNVIKHDLSAAVLDGGDGRKQLTELVNHPILHMPNTECLYEVDGPHSVRVISIPEADVRRSLEQVGIHDLAVLDRIAFQELPDRRLARLMNEMWAESQRHGASAALAVDAHYHAILARLVARAEAVPKRLPRPTLGDKQIARAIELIDAQLGERIDARMLATATGFSEFHFARAFRERVGQTPHQYVIERRLQRAREKLTTTNDAIADIAYECGFASQAHMTTTFSNRLNVTPAMYRRECRG